MAVWDLSHIPTGTRSLEASTGALSTRTSTGSSFVTDSRPLSQFGGRGPLNLLPVSCTEYSLGVEGVKLQTDFEMLANWLKTSIPGIVALVLQ
jgi:hypothetical protein